MMPRAGRYYLVSMYDEDIQPLSSVPEDEIVYGRALSVGLVVNGTPKDHSEGAHQ